MDETGQRRGEVRRAEQLGGKVGGAAVLQPLWRRREASLWVEGELGMRSLQQRRAANLLRDDRTVTFRTTLYGSADIGGGRFRFSTTLTQGLGLFGATLRGDPLASRPDAGGSFTAVNSWADWTVGLGSGFSLRLAAQGQLAFAPLLVTEEFGLGGTAFLRGYDWSERSGDQGVTGLAERVREGEVPRDPGLLAAAPLGNIFPVRRPARLRASRIEACCAFVPIVMQARPGRLVRPRHGGGAREDPVLSAYRGTLVVREHRRAADPRARR